MSSAERMVEARFDSSRRCEARVRLIRRDLDGECTVLPAACLASIMVVRMQVRGSEAASDQLCAQPESGAPVRAHIAYHRVQTTSQIQLTHKQRAN